MATQNRPRGRPPKHMFKDGRCRFFRADTDGYCKHYAGSRKSLEGCYSKCLKRRDAD